MKEWVHIRAPVCGAAPDVGERTQRVGRTGGFDPQQPFPRLRASAGPLGNPGLAPLVPPVHPLHPRLSGSPLGSKEQALPRAHLSGHFSVTARAVPGTCCLTPAGRAPSVPGTDQPGSAGLEV